MSFYKVPLPADLTKFFINGKYVNPSTNEVFTVRNPKDDTIISDKVPAAGPDDVDTAVEYAEAAFYGEWSRFSGAQRSRCLHKLADLLEEPLEEILKLDALVGGNPVSIIRTQERDYILGGLRYIGKFQKSRQGSAVMG